MKHILWIAAVAMCLTSCGNEGRIENTKELSREIKASQIKRVTNTQLVYSADEWGKKIARIAEKSLTSEIAKDPSHAQAACADLSTMPVIAALEKEYGVQVSLLGSADLKNPALAPKEREILEAYQYSARSGATASDNLQQLNDTLLVYNAPVTAGSAIRKTCLTAQDSTFAVWRLLFSKKEIIRKLDAKQLK
ncbi:hypothetical protein [Dyadobacter sandarakinus]|uniref:Lipoprotein n=1 Tax=Dyadobacter sandarakinus TaxID=2747268 RepID=A0ABX7I9S1_9BACT|nr:hypothetical protein [Dyadobacter sandarakinus]QRR02558.1 hypothetical protein HWI92_17405 [Dyadobacter sandarakinus]